MFATGQNLQRSGEIMRVDKSVPAPIMGITEKTFRDWLAKKQVSNIVFELNKAGHGTVTFNLAGSNTLIQLITARGSTKEYVQIGTAIRTLRLLGIEEMTFRMKSFKPAK